MLNAFLEEARLIYVAHPYGGQEKNKKATEEIIKRLYRLIPDKTFISPIHGICCPYESVSFEDGIKYCLNLLGRCDLLMLTGEWEKSPGCNREKEYAERQGIRVAILSKATYEGGLRISPVVNADSEDNMVDHPSHYTQGGVECIDAIKAATVNLTGIKSVCTGNALKYIWRWHEKNGTEDIRKAIWYLNRLISEVNNE